jgi:hypothetical protein
MEALEECRCLVHVAGGHHYTQGSCQGKEQAQVSLWCWPGNRGWTCNSWRWFSIQVLHVMRNCLKFYCLNRVYSCVSIEHIHLALASWLFRFS